MKGQLNIPYCARSIATALLNALKAGTVAKIGIDDIRAAAVGYCASFPDVFSKEDLEKLVEATLRKTVELV